MQNVSYIESKDFNTSDPLVVEDELLQQLVHPESSSIHIPVDIYKGGECCLILVIIIIIIIILSITIIAYNY